MTTRVPFYYTSGTLNSGTPAIVPINPPAGATWEINYFKVVMNTGTTVGRRFIAIELSNGDIVCYPGAQTTVSSTFNAVTSPAYNSASSGGTGYILQANLLIPSGTGLQLSLSLLSGDTATAVFWGYIVWP